MSAYDPKQMFIPSVIIRRIVHVICQQLLCLERHR